MTAREPGAFGRLVAAAIPTLWLVAFFLVPFLLIARISLSTPELAQPPYTPQFDIGEGWGAIADKLARLSLAAYRAVFDDDIYLYSFLGSLRIAALSTALALLIAYPLALGIARAPRQWRLFLVMLAMAPCWTSFLARVYAWIMILKDEGLLFQALSAIGLVQKPLAIFGSEPAVILGIAYAYLPFMLLPIYAALHAQDATLVEAARDLGAGPRRAFWRVTFPLSLKGVAAGCTLVFIPAMGEYVIPDLLGGSDMLVTGRTLWDEFFRNRDWPAASALAILLLLIIVPALAILGRARSRSAAQ